MRSYFFQMGFIFLLACSRFVATQSACRLLSPPLHCRRLASLLCGAGKTETEVGAAVVGVAVVPVINPAVVAVVAGAA